MRSTYYSSMLYSQRPSLPWGGQSREDMNRKVLNRLKFSEGHVRGTERMVVEELYCTIGIKRVSVVRSGTHGALHNFLFQGFSGNDQMWIEA